MQNIENLINEIIDSCETIIKNKNYFTPNIKIINVIFNEFKEIKEFYEFNKKILLLSKPVWKLTSIRVIIDSADYNYDSKLFDNVRKFKRYTDTLDEKLIEYRYK
ncbi:MAG: hypothetical protein IJV77_02030 [Clostridia bacterium]|nr:hypothetical protein [Clostridia bacterium]